MRHGIGADLGGNFNLLLGDQRAGNGCAEQVQAFIERIRTHHGEDVVAAEFFTNVLNEDMLFLDAGHAGLLAGRLNLFALPQIGGEGHDFTTIGLLKPLHDDAGIQPARIGEDNAVDLLLVSHMEGSSCSPKQRVRA